MLVGVLHFCKSVSNLLQVLQLCFVSLSLSPFLFFLIVSPFFSSCYLFTLSLISQSCPPSLFYFSLALLHSHSFTFLCRSLSLLTSFSSLPLPPFKFFSLSLDFISCMSHSHLSVSLSLSLSRSARTLITVPSVFVGEVLPAPAERRTRCKQEVELR